MSYRAYFKILNLEAMRRFMHKWADMYCRSLGSIQYSQYLHDWQRQHIKNREISNLDNIMINSLDDIFDAR